MEKISTRAQLQNKHNKHSSKSKTGKRVLLTKQNVVSNAMWKHKDLTINLQLLL